MSNKISHSGIVESVAGENVRVRILQTSACASCKVAGHCNASEAKEKLVDVGCTDSKAYHPGQEVVVTASSAVARRALLLGFGLPFLLMVMALLTVSRLSGNEGMAALAAIGILAPYYMLLWLLRNSISRRVNFQIE